MKRTIKAIVWLSVLSILFVIYLGYNIIYFGINVKPVKSDCIIILGCRVYGTEPSPFLKARMDESIRLYKEGYGKYIIVSGGKGPGEDISEASAMKEYLISKDIDKEKIIMEDKSSSTMANLTLSRERMEQNGLKTAVIVSNRYHLKRASLMAERIGINGSYSGVFVENYKGHEITGFLREILALLKFYLIPGI